MVLKSWRKGGSESVMLMEGPEEDVREDLVDSRGT